MDALLDETEAGILLSLRPRQVLRLARIGELPYVAITGKEIRFRREDLERFVEDRSTLPPPLRSKRAAQRVLESLDADELRQRIKELTREREAVQILHRAALHLKRAAEKAKPS